MRILKLSSKRSRGAWTPSALHTRFTVSSLFVTVLIAAGFGWLVSRQMIENTLDDAARETVKTVNALIAPQVAAEDFGAPTPARVAKWKQRLDRVVGTDVVRIKVWNARGQVVYSDEPSLIGQVYPLEGQEDLRAALNGKIHKELTALEKSENVAERSYGQLLEIYSPVAVPPDSQEVVGAYEVYRNFSPLQARIGHAKQLIWAWAAAAFGLLYASLLLLYKGANRQLSWLASFPERNPSPVIEMDAAGNITYLNPAAARLFPDLQTSGFQHPLMAGLKPAAADLRNGVKRSLRREVKVGDVFYEFYEQDISYIPDATVTRIHCVDVTERKKAEDVASRANQARSEFLSRMSHELRTPLNAILGFAELLGMNSLNSKQREAVGHILKAGRHLLELINEVLDITRIDAGRLVISLEPVPIDEVIQETLDLIAPMATGGEVWLYAEPLRTSARYVSADRQRLKQVLLNLLSNAVKYNRRGGMVTLASEEILEGRLRVKVSDTGPGISPEKMERLFTPFDRLGAEQTAVEGTGLGLAFSKRLIESMGGSLGVESKAGQGSTFWVELAIAECPNGPAKPMLSDSWNSAGTETARLVLYIEDQLSNMRLIQHLLAGWQEVRIVPAMQGQMGLDLAREHHPDLILLDLHLPDLPGDEVLRRLRKSPETAHIPVVVISADAIPSQIERLLAAGASAYFTKPLEIQKFLDFLGNILREPKPVG